MSSSSVFLSNVDDYLAPSQACVNPLFGGGKQKDDEEKKEEATNSKPKTNNVVIPRQHRRKRQQQQQLQQQEDGSNGVGVSAVGGLMDVAVAAASTLTAASTTIAASSSSPFSMDVQVVPSIIDKLANPALENNNNNNNNNNTIKDDPIVKASIADCLACSGCVTTAETVLLEEQHSLDLLRERFVMHHNDDNGGRRYQQQQRMPMVMTISPAAWADLSRHLDLPITLSSNNNNSNNLQLHHQQQQFTTLLSQTFSNLAFVMDGNVPLEWSLQEAAREFCRAHNSNNKINKEDDAMEIMDDGGQDEMDIVDDATTATTSTTTTAAPLPLVASSCPAVVCLVEKSIHKAVPHLSTVKSPMSMAGAYWRSVANSNNKFFHVAVMPCHDKKLEASRGASISTSRSAVAATAPKHEQDVDLVITTSECLQLLQEAQQLQQEQKVAKEEIATMINNGGNGNNNTDDSSNRDQSSKNNNSNNNTRLRSLLLSCPPAPCILTNNTEDPTSIMSRLDAAAMDAASTALNTNTTTRTTTTTLITISSSSSSSCSDSMDETTTTASTSSTASPFVYGSGGYADYIFRYACRELYGFVVKANTNPWRTVTPTTSTAAASNSRIRKSVRVAASQQRNRQRDYYQAILYRHASTGEYSLTATTNNDQEYQPVLRFAIAYGMQTLQRVLRPFHDDDIKGDSPVQQQSSLLSNGTNGHKKQPQQHAYDYIEAMACPSGCLNGGGQLPLPSATPKIAQTKTTSTAIIAARETPTQTRQRVQMTQAQFAVAPSSSNANQQPQFDSSSSSSSSSSAIMTMLKRIPEAERHATYHAVAPLQLSMGAGAGVAVQDIQW